jgi:hypothetical protein
MEVAHGRSRTGRRVYRKVDEGELGDMGLSGRQ